MKKDVLYKSDSFLGSIILPILVFVVLDLILYFNSQDFITAYWFYGSQLLISYLVSMGRTIIIVTQNDIFIKKPFSIFFKEKLFQFVDIDSLYLYCDKGSYFKFRLKSGEEIKLSLQTDFATSCYRLKKVLINQGVKVDAHIPGY